MSINSGDCAGGYYPSSLGAKGTQEKLMEPELLHSPEMAQLDDTDSCASDDIHPTQSSSCFTSPNPSPDRLPEFEYEDFIESRQVGSSVVPQFPPDTKWNVDAFIALLYKPENFCESIQGFCVSLDGTELDVDIDEGKVDIVSVFFQERFPAEWSSKRIELIEQEACPEFLIHTGDKIAVERNGVAVGERTDLLANYGTLTCLGDSDHNVQYALTAKHIFCKENRAQEDSKRIYSGFNCRVTEISTSYKGILGGYSCNGHDKQVDIAAVLLADDVTQRFDQRMVHNLKDMFKREDRHLQDVRVTKRGASSGDTLGVIIKHSHNSSNRQQRVITGDQFMIKPKNGDYFAIAGDSGALIWSTTGIPIGIVSQGQRRYTHKTSDGGRWTGNVVMAVRLDHCLAALAKEWKINIVQCKSYGALLPYASSVPEPRVDHVDEADALG